MTDKTPVSENPDSASKPSTTASSNSLWADCAESFLQPALQKPVTAIAQAIDLAGRTHLAEKSHFVGAPQARAYGSPGWLMEEVAGGAGSAVPYVLTALAVKPLIKSVVGNALLKTGLSAETVVGITGFAETTATGFGTGAIFNPSTDIHSFWAGRMQNGITSGATMASLHLLSNGLGKYTGARAVEAGIGIRALNTAVAGLGAGAVSAETQSFLATGHGASLKDVTKSAISMSITGGVLGAAGDGLLRLNQLRSSFPEIQNHVVDKGGKPHEFANYFEHQAGKKFEDMSPIGRVDFVTAMERQAKSPLARPEPMAAFVAKMQALGRNWAQEDIPALTARAEQARVEYLAKFKEIDSAQLALSKKYQGNVTVVDNDGKIIHESAPERRLQSEALDKELQAARDNSKFHEDAWRQAFDRRAEEIKSTVNEFLQAHDLPAVSIRAHSALPGGASANYAAGELGLDYSVIQSANLSDTTTGIVFHELIHLEQDNLRIKNFADKMGLGKNPTSAQIEELAEKAFPLIKNEDNLLPGDHKNIINFVGRVLTLRDGKPLSRAEGQRAERMADAMDRYKAPWTAKAEKQYEMTYNVKDVLEGRLPDALDRFLIKLRKTPEYYGFRSVPKSLQVLAQRAYEHSSEGQAEKAQQEQLAAFAKLDFSKGALGSKGSADKNGKVSDPDAGNLSLGRAAAKNTAQSAEAAAHAEPVVSGSKWMNPSEQALVRDVLSRQLNLLIGQSERFAARSSRWYLNNAMEQEAFPSGLLMQFTAEKRSKDTQPKQP